MEQNLLNIFMTNIKETCMKILWNKPYTNFALTNCHLNKKGHKRR